VDDVVLDDRPPDEQLRDLAAGLGLADEQMVVLTTADPLARHLGPRALRLADSADLWPAQLAAGGLYDCLPMVPTDAGAPGWEADVDFAVARRQRSLSVEEYVAGLGVCVTWRDADRDAAPSVTEMAMRTKDFTLGVDHTEQSLEAALADESTEIMLASVRDRLGDYGVGAAVRLRYADDACIVDLLLVSCPVLGKGVEDEVLSRILKLAEGRQCKTVTFRYSDTGRNGMALAYLRKVAAADQSPGVAVHLEPLP
jgi:predicted enzyme involved in methoxymalonyl-ACP biosynthesis